MFRKIYVCLSYNTKGTEKMTKYNLSVTKCLSIRYNFCVASLGLFFEQVSSSSRKLSIDSNSKLR